MLVPTPVHADDEPHPTPSHSPPKSVGCGPVCIRDRPSCWGMSSLTSSTRGPRSAQAALHSTTHLPRLPHGVELINDDCISAMRRLPDSSVDSVVCDPPYGLSKAPDMAEVLRHWLAGDDYTHTSNGFMGKSWDSFVPGPSVWRECFRVLKPGGHLMAFAGSPTVDLMGLSIRLSGFEIRDQMQWLYGTGWPKSANVGHKLGYTSKTALGSQLKPAHEPIIVARKPLDGSLVANVRTYGTGALRIDDCRIEGEKPACANSGFGAWRNLEGRPTAERPAQTYDPKQGRWPANVILDSEAARRLDEQSGCRAGGNAPKNNTVGFGGVYTDGTPRAGVRRDEAVAFNGGGASRLFRVVEEDLLVGDGMASGFQYCVKPSRGERDAGLASVDEGNCIALGAAGDADDSQRAGGSSTRRNTHSTVKPVALMRYLQRLVTPDGGVTLDPFMGSGTSGCAAVLEGLRFIGIEVDTSEGYFEIAARRIAHWAPTTALGEAA